MFHQNNEKKEKREIPAVKMAEHVNLCGNTGYTVYNGHSLDTENLHGEPWKLMPLFAQTEAHSPPWDGLIRAMLIIIGRAAVSPLAVKK